MRSIKLSAVFWLALLLLSSSTNQVNALKTGKKFPRLPTADTIADKYQKYINLNAYLRPFWQSDTITDETLLVINDNGVLKSPLLYKCKKILAVKAANYSKEFIAGKDWYLKNGNLIITPGSVIPSFHPQDLVFNKEIPGKSMGGKVSGTFVLFNEGPYFSSQQISVTYIKQKDQQWAGPAPQFASSSLPGTIKKLTNGQKLKVVFYGNSIEVGYNASGLEDKPPYMPVWPKLLISNLQKHYSGGITFVNKSVAGRLAKWGQDSVTQKVIPENPDLVIIGFGMNDGTMRVPKDIYCQQIKAIIDAVTFKSPRTEFILIAPMLANPLSSFDGLQSVYKQDLDKLAGAGIVVADITGVHAELLKHKSYQDMTGNNVNHPNDYLARWYAQFISGFLIKY